MTRSEIAIDTVRILELGFAGNADIRNALEFALEYSALYTGTEPELEFKGRGRYQTKISITNQTTLEALEPLARAEPNEVMCLSFASAKNPGGGFLNGAQAQEESLARSSALYKTLLDHPMFYEFHRRQHDLLYSHRMIYSQHVPVFKNDAGEILEPYTVAFITCAAPNAGAIATNQPQSLALIPTVLEQRAALVLGLAANNQHQRLVLGAWGCGVFKNNPHLVAEVFKNLLEGQFKNVFAQVVFAVHDKSKGTPIYTAFEEVFI